MHTPMVYVCQGRQLRASHLFFAAKKALTAGADGEGCAGLDLGGAAKLVIGGLRVEVVVEMQGMDCDRSFGS